MSARKPSPSAAAWLVAKHADLDCEVWAKWDASADIYELFSEPEGVCYLGCADTRAECHTVARAHFEELMSY